MNLFARIAEERICEAQKQGTFDNLPGSGKPLPPENGPHVPEDLRMAYKILKNSGYLPEEIAERKEIDTLLQLLENDSPEKDRLRAMRRLEALLFSFSRKGRSIAFGERDIYYTNVVARLERLKHR